MGTEIRVCMCRTNALAILFIYTCILRCAEYSLLDGINRTDTLPEYIKSLGQKAVAITDHGNVSGSYEFYKSCNKAGVQPIIGMEAYYSTAGRKIKERDDLGQNYYHMVLIALNNEGLHNLFKLSSRAYEDGMYYKPRIDDELIGELSGGIMATTACLGSRISQLILNDRVADAEYVLDHHKAMFDNRLLIELQLHEGEQEIVNKVLFELAAKKNMPMILTNDCHYQLEQDKLLHESALCMQTGDHLSNPKRFSFGDIDVHVASRDWMWNRASRLHLPYEVIDNTAYVAELVDSDDYFSDRLNRYPKFQGLIEGVTAADELAYQAQKGLLERFDGDMPPVAYRERLDHELHVIKKMGFSNYLLIVQEFIDAARELEVPVGPGRGSAAGSLVAYALNVTQIDPIKYDLIFERFLNAGRGAIPVLFSKEMKQHAISTS